MSGSAQNNNSQGYTGQIGPNTTYLSPSAAIQFAIKQGLAKKETSMPVVVIAVHGGGVSAPCTVDVQPMVNQVDGNGNQVPHGTIFGIPVERQQAGGASIIHDPVVGTKGVLAAQDRDISNIKNSGAIGGPGSDRKGKYSDGVFRHGLDSMGGTYTAPSTYIQITPTGIIVQGPTWGIDASGNFWTNGTITALNSSTSVSLTTHLHTNTQTGSGFSGPPKEPS